MIASEIGLVSALSWESTARSVSSLPIRFGFDTEEVGMLRRLAAALYHQPRRSVTARYNPRILQNARLAKMCLFKSLLLHG